LLHGGQEKRDTFVNEALRQGFILTPAFSELLPRYEKQPDAFRLYYPDLIAALDVKKEQKRLKDVEFAQSAPQRVIAPPAKMQLDPAEESLQTAEGLYENYDFQNATTLFKKVFSQTDNQSMHGRAYYGLARIAVREKRLSDAEDLFTRTAENNPGPAITAWAHVYLGRLALASGNAGKAGEQFRAALAIDGISAMAREAAEKGMESTSSSGEKQQ
jgi:tetratricopeptide (TPR) repeat protein